MNIYIPVVLPSAIVFALFLFNCGLMLMGRTIEETEQNRTYTDCPKKMDSKKNSGSWINPVCTERKREKPWDI